ncbi:interleukin-1 beta-like [Tachyglossus aculeatus]|uniref:interleukin-1 beta-like n=1 Tax=Tachyglossus aculeatus TaxID=9261 RepID=UPI0018F6256E|nr:interleukin-1 beta-like [Tachyglossus aculeatus]
MARVPDQSSDLMDCYSGDGEEQFYEDNGPSQVKSGFQDLKARTCQEARACQEDDCSPCQMGIELKVTELSSSRGFRRAVVLVVAMEKLKRQVVACDMSFMDRDLMDIFTTIFKEEPVSCTSWEQTLVTDSIYHYLRCQEVTIWDQEHKSFTLNTMANPCELRALHLIGANATQEVKLNMNFYYKTEHPAGPTVKQPVTLGIKGGNPGSLYLSCVKKGDKPTLQLEVVNQSDLEGKNQERFIFNKSTEGTSTTFESAAYPNWYISTSREEDEPVFLGASKGEEAITNFYLN